MAAAPPITSARPTNLEIAQGVNKAHECIHQLDEKLERRDRAQSLEIARIQGALGLKPSDRRAQVHKVRRNFAGMGYWTGIGTILAGVSGAQLVYKIGEPVVAALLMQLHHQLMNVH